MPIKVKCPNEDCGKVAVVKDEFAGKRAKCTGCGTILTVPGGPAVQRQVAARAQAGARAPAAHAPTHAATPAPKPKARPRPADAEDVEYPAEELGSGPAGAAGPRGTVPMFVGLGMLALLAVSVFLPWVSIFGLGISGMNFTGGLVVLILAVAALAGVTTMFFLKTALPALLLAGGAAGTVGLLTVLGVLFKGSPGLGLWIGLVGALGATGAFVFASTLNPCHFPFNKEGASPFLRNFGALLGAQGIALVLGLVMMLVGTGVGMGALGGLPSGGFPGQGGKMPDFKMPNF